MIRQPFVEEMVLSSLIIIGQAPKDLFFGNRGSYGT